MLSDAALARASWLTFDKTVDVATFLTFVTLVFGLLGWTYKAIKEWRRDARHEAEGGALRLLLKILRDRYTRDAGPISLSDLRTEFERPERKSERRAYCERDFHFKDDEYFERAIYELQWEFKIDFVDGDKILFRTRPANEIDEIANRGHFAYAVDPQLALSSFKDALGADDLDTYDLERLARIAAIASPDATREALVGAIDKARGDPTRLRRLLILTEELRRR